MDNEIIKFLHIICIITWMAGTLYLPRLYAHHVTNKDNYDFCTIFYEIEFKLLYYITIPMGVLANITGYILLKNSTFMTNPWMHYKLTFVLIFIILNYKLIRWLSDFKNQKYTKTPWFFKMAHHVATISMISTVFLVTVKPHL